MVEKVTKKPFVGSGANDHNTSMYLSGSTPRERVICSPCGPRQRTHWRLSGISPSSSGAGAGMSGSSSWMFSQVANTS
jgi:hypothetical protein